MKVAVVPDDAGAVGYYRQLWPAQAVQALHPDWDIRPYRPNSLKIREVYGKRGVQVSGVDFRDLDLIVLQRVGTANEVSMIKALQARGIAVLLDIDDALHCIPKSNAAWPLWNKDPECHWSHLEKAARLADLVTVTTGALAKHYGKHNRVEKIPNFLPDIGYPRVPEGTGENSPIVIGWAGSRHVHADDLKVVGGALKAVLDENEDVCVKIVGDAQWAARQLQVPRSRLIDAGHTSLSEYYPTLAGTDIGIVPLEDNRFNQAKSWLKAMEYMGAGAHVIASDTPANRELARRVTALDIAEFEEESWGVLLHYAIEDMRRVSRPLIRKAKQKRVAPLRMLDNAGIWADAYKRAVNRRRSLLS